MDLEKFSPSKTADDVPQRDKIIELVMNNFELWHANGTAMVSGPVDGPLENRPVRDRIVRTEICGLYFDAKGTAPGGQAIEDALRVIESKALKGREYPLFLRTGEDEGGVYIDLADKERRVIHVKPDGWEVIENSPVKFERSPSMTAFPTPEPGESIDRFRQFVNVVNDNDFKLLVSWLVAALRPRGPYPVLCINGEQGAAKSTLTKLLRNLTDPSLVLIRRSPKDEMELAVAARNSKVLAFDNLSNLSQWLSDDIARLSTGGGFAARELYSNWAESFFFGYRAVILNGIPDLAGRADLADRAIAITLPTINENNRRDEATFDRDFKAEWPFIFGALLDGLSSALRRLPEMEIEQAPRMKDFALWSQAAEQGLGWEEGSFIAAYRRNRAELVETAIEGDSIAFAVRELAEAGGWEGTAGELLERIKPLPKLHGDDQETHGRVGESFEKTKAFPKAPHLLSMRLRRGAPALRAVGVNIRFQKSQDKSRRRMIAITFNGSAAISRVITDASIVS